MKAELHRSVSSRTMMRKKRKTLWIVAIMSIVVLVVFLFFLGKQFSSTGKPIDDATLEDSPENSAQAQSGFIAVCDRVSCTTFPTRVERAGEVWQLGFYLRGYAADGTPQLSYKSESGEVVALDGLP